jgi:hypothetical protein
VGSHSATSFAARLRAISLQPSQMMSSSGLAKLPKEPASELRRRFACQPGFSPFAQTGSVGRLPRAST